MLHLPSSLPVTVTGGDKIFKHVEPMEPLKPAVSADSLLSHAYLTERLEQAPTQAIERLERPERSFSCLMPHSIEP